MMIIFTACASNCMDCSDIGPGKCDECEVGYARTSSMTCEG